VLGGEKMNFTQSAMEGVMAHHGLMEVGTRSYVPLYVLCDSLTEVLVLFYIFLSFFFLKLHFDQEEFQQNTWKK
jgi:hypothetical protein